MAKIPEFTDDFFKGQRDKQSKIWHSLGDLCSTMDCKECWCCFVSCWQCCCLVDHGDVFFLVFVVLVGRFMIFRDETSHLVAKLCLIEPHKSQQLPKRQSMHQISGVVWLMTDQKLEKVFLRTVRTIEIPILGISVLPICVGCKTGWPFLSPTFLSSSWKTRRAGASGRLWLRIWGRKQVEMILLLGVFRGKHIMRSHCPCKTKTTTVGLY